MNGRNKVIHNLQIIQNQLRQQLATDPYPSAQTALGHVNNALRVLSPAFAGVEQEGTEKNQGRGKLSKFNTTPPDLNSNPLPQKKNVARKGMMGGRLVQKEWSEEELQEGLGEQESPEWLGNEPQKYSMDERFHILTDAAERAEFLALPGDIILTSHNGFEQSFQLVQLNTGVFGLSPASEAKRIDQDEEDEFVLISTKEPIEEEEEEEVPDYYERIRNNFTSMSEEELSSLYGRTDLKELCGYLELSKAGNKDEMIVRIKEHFENDPD